MERLQKRLRLRSLPTHIECFDVSLFQGDTPVVSQVVFIDGKPKKSLYRQYNIKTVVGTDDYAMLSEAISRRLTRGLQENNLPQLLIVDGGKGQLQAIMKTCRMYNITPDNNSNLMVVAIAKARHLGDSGRGYVGKKKSDPEDKSPERVA